MNTSYNFIFNKVSDICFVCAGEVSHQDRFLTFTASSARAKTGDSGPQSQDLMALHRKLYGIFGMERRGPS